MARLEDLTRGAQVAGLRPDGPVTVVDATWYGTAAVELTLKDSQGKPGNELLYRTDGARLEDAWLREDLEGKAVGHAVANLVPKHLEDVRSRREEIVERTKIAVKDRLTKEINYWDHRAEDLRAQEQAGRTPALNSAKARQRADDLQARLKKRLSDLELERQFSALPPIVVGGALVIPAGLLAHLQGTPDQEAEAIEATRIEGLAMRAVINAERALGFEPRDVSADRCGYDIESRVPGTGKLRLIEVKGRHKDGKTVMVTKNEILTALNKPEDFVVAVVQVDGEIVAVPRYLRRPFQKEPDFGVTSVNYAMAELERAGPPA